MDRSQGNKALNQVCIGHEKLLRQAGVQAPDMPPVPTPTEEGEEAAGAWKAASTKLKKLGEKKINMQKQVDSAKDALRGILKDMQSLQEQINLAQKELDQATLQYQAKVVQTQDKTMAQYDVEKILQDFGIVLSPEQQAKLESARMQNKRKAVAQEVPGDQPPPSVARGRR